MKIENSEPFAGQHCETNATGNLLKHAGLELSEPMLFGLGEGLAFAVLAFKNMPMPFIGGRSKGEEITKNLSKNLGFDLAYRETRSKKKAWENVAGFIDAGQPVGVKIDMFFLDHFELDQHFAGHYLAVYGYDDDYVYVADSVSPGRIVSTDRCRFEEGRLWKGPMSSNALTWTISVGDGEIDWPTVITAAITSNVDAYLNPPISNFGIKGIRKAAKLIPTWLDTLDNATETLAQIGWMMENGGTGGSLFRGMYRDFLAEANEHLDHPVVENARRNYDEAADLWTDVANKLMSVGSEGPTAVAETAEMLQQLADIEEDAIVGLSKLADM
jgi:hypothetical protein